MRHSHTNLCYTVESTTYVRHSHTTYAQTEFGQLHSHTTYVTLLVLQESHSLMLAIVTTLMRHTRSHTYLCDTVTPLCYTVTHLATFTPTHTLIILLMRHSHTLLMRTVYTLC
jgi:hypothetical protein